MVSARIYTHIRLYTYIHTYMYIYFNSYTYFLEASCHGENVADTNMAAMRPHRTEASCRHELDRPHTLCTLRTKGATRATHLPLRPEYPYCISHQQGDPHVPFWLRQ